MIRLRLAITAALVATSALAAHAQHHPPVRRHKAAVMVAYDAKDRKYYSVAYAKAHHMHDKGGDLLTIRPLSSLPRDAKLSHAMHGKL